MRVPQEVIARYGTACEQAGAGREADDADAVAFLQTFDEPPGAKILVAGCHDECVANMLSDAGFEVVGFDLREYDERLPRCNYRFVCGDFCSMPETFVRRYEGKFDAFVSLSSIEHFGLGTYGESVWHPYYDAVALRAASRMVRPGGSAYVTVPYGQKYLEHGQDWRVYDWDALVRRVCRPFGGGGAMSFGFTFFTSAEAVVGGQRLPGGCALSKEQADSYHGDPPHVTVLAKITKPS